ncbi:MAG: hypothetical protein MUE69_26280 [Myxococcota bacterium]|nr:hypothetical protein [Myxococcota bacterium]
MPTTSSLRRVATSPAWWLALTLLVLNDHVLKRAFPGALTGKLSDFAGLFVAAPLLSALVARTRRARIVAYVATGAVFAAINVSPAVAEVVERLLAWRIWTDPSDLIALPMLLVAWRRYESLAKHETSSAAIEGLRATRLGWTERLAVALGGLACVATSRWPVDVPPPWTGELQITGLYAETYEDESDRREDVRIRRLLPEVELDCEALATRPEETVTRRLFAPVERWSLGHRELLQFITGAGAGTSRECDVIWLEHDEAGVALVRWSADVAGRVALERNGDAIGWVEEIGSNLIVRRSPRAPIPARTCEPAPIPPSVDGTWPTGPYDTRYAVQAEASPDGCTRVTLAEVADPPPVPAEPGDWGDELPPELPEVPLRPSTVLYACGYPAELFSVFDGPVRIVGVDPLQLEQLDDDGTLRASLVVSETDASGVPSFLRATRIEECEAANACGEIATPWRVELAPRLDAEWRAEGTGGFVSSDDLSRVQVLLAQSSVAVDRACVDGVGELGERFVVAYATRVPVVPEEPMEPVEDPSDEPSDEPTSDEPPTEDEPAEPSGDEPSGDDPLPAEEPGGGA